MKWTNGLTQTAKRKRRERWHKWFLWYPKTMGFVGKETNERKLKVWFEVIERRLIVIGWVSKPPGILWQWKYEYRIPKKRGEKR